MGWCQFGPPVEVAIIKNRTAYEKDLGALPDWRIGCLFTGSKHRRHSVARTALAAALRAITVAGVMRLTVEPDGSLVPSRR